MWGKFGKSLITRTVSGAVFLAIIVGACLFSPYSLLAVVLVVCVGCMSEYYKMAASAGAEPQRWTGITLGMLLILVSLFTTEWFIDFNGNRFILPVASILPFVIFFAELYRKKEQPILNVATTVTGIVYVAVPLALIMWMSGQNLSEAFRFEGVHSTEGFHPATILIYLAFVWCTDVGGYLFGIAFGRHKLIERISPKKTWEGLAGSFFLTILAAFLIAHFTGGFYIFWIVLAVIVVLSGLLGDLVESMFKRSVNLKDSGRIMPGHGGFMDRFDALLLSAPFVSVYFIIFAP